MSISDLIVVMKKAEVQQVGIPQDVYDDPKNLFVAQFLGTPPINVFAGEIREEKVYLGEDCILDAPGIEDKEVHVGIRPEGFIVDENGPLHCKIRVVEVMGRDTSIVSSHPVAETETIRSIIDSEDRPAATSGTVTFSLRKSKVLLFDMETEERIYPC